MSTKTVFMEDIQNESAYHSEKVDVRINSTGEDLYYSGELLTSEELEYFVIKI